MTSSEIGDPFGNFLISLSLFQVPTALCQPFNQLSLLPHIYEKGLVILLLLLLLLDLRNNPARRANSQTDK